MSALSALGCLRDAEALHRLSTLWLGWQPVMPAAVERTGPIGEQDWQAGLDWLKHEAKPKPARGTIKAAQTGGDRGAHKAQVARLELVLQQCTQSPTRWFYFR